MRVAMVEDEEIVARSMIRRLTRHSIDVVHLSTPDEIEGLIAGAGRDDEYDVILLDVNLPLRNGVEILQRLRARGTCTAIVMVTGDNSAATATAALRAGAYHYVVKSDVDDHFVDVLDSASAHTALSRLQRSPHHSAGGDSSSALVGQSSHIAGLRAQLRRVAMSSANVLLTGESGTGKEVAARELHHRSARAHKPFVPLNCGGIPEGLIDSELFGHVRGAFTGATANRAGVFVEADGGTLFLDEVGDMPLPVQARLLRAIQHGEVRPVGGAEARTIDVRIVAATNVDLDRAVAEGHFRADLLFRLNVINIALVPLRDRRSDLAPLAAALLQKHRPNDTPTLSPSAMEAMCRYAWPGNVRELENAMLHGLAMASSDVIEVSDLPPAVAARSKLAAGSGLLHRITDDSSLTDASAPLTEAKRTAALEFEREYLRKLMLRAQGSVSLAARMAGVDRTNFRRLLHRHDIDASRFRA